MKKDYAFFLPQFHETEENNEYWGKGFTEWTNVKAARPYFNGHQQPKAPLTKYYDLSRKDELNGQLNECANSGLDGVIYWHYYFNRSQQALNHVPKLHLEGDNKLEFSFAWANTSWTMSWKGDDRTIIFNQEYNIKDVPYHADYLASYMKDGRYSRIDDLPIFYMLNCNDQATVIYVNMLVERLRVAHGLEIILGLADHIGEWTFACRTFYFHYPPGTILRQSIRFKLFHKFQRLFKNFGPHRVPAKRYNALLAKYLKRVKSDLVPTILTGWDNTPRYGRRGYLVIGGSIREFVNEQRFTWRQSSVQSEIDITLWKSWNEWAEGNIMEGYNSLHKDSNSIDVNEVK